MTAFTAAVQLERARLALADPAGELDAIAPLSRTKALAIVRKLTAAPQPSGSRSPHQPRDDRDILAALGVSNTAGRGMARCPNHEDSSPSLSWRTTPDGRVLLHCFAGCEFGEILAAIGAAK